MEVYELNDYPTVQRGEQLFKIAQLIPAWTRLSGALLEAELISPEEFRQRKEVGVERAKELVRQISHTHANQGKTKISRSVRGPWII